MTSQYVSVKTGLILILTMHQFLTSQIWGNEGKIKILIEALALSRNVKKQYDFFNFLFFIPNQPNKNHFPHVFRVGVPQQNKCQRIVNFPRQMKGGGVPNQGAKGLPEKSAKENWRK